MLSLLFCVFAVAQTKQVSGRVTKQGSDESLSGVTVTLKGTPTITTTNSEGRYTIDVSASGNPVLVYSYVGHQSVEKKVAGATMAGES